MAPEFAEAISRTDLAVFVDAAAEGSPGEVRRIEVEAAPAAPAFSHQATPGALLHMAAVLYGRAARGVLFSIAGANFELGECLSPEVARSVREVAGAIVRLTDAGV
jgi:hydrogenase maturation protease